MKMNPEFKTVHQRKQKNNLFENSFTMISRPAINLSARVSKRDRDEDLCELLFISSYFSEDVLFSSLPDAVNLSHSPVDLQLGHC